MNTFQRITLLGSCLAPTLVSAQAIVPAVREDSVLQPVVITGAAPERRRWLSPSTVDIVDGEEIHAGQLQVNVSESLGRVPGLLIQNRQNYAQDLQISVRGFGARSTFGVRGVRLFVDGIPASAPDGQGQAANFPLGMAQRIEVLRGPYAALYGSSSGGVIALYTVEGRMPASLQAGVAGGADGLRRVSTQAQGTVGSLSYVLDASDFATDGLRPQSAARRDTGYLKLSRPHDDGRVVVIVNRQTGVAQDPLGLSRAEFSANAYQTTPNASVFNARKGFDQTQMGAAWEQRLSGGQRLEFMAYAGRRAVTQYQAIPAATQLAATSSGGVIDLDRSYGGINARWRVDREWDTGRLTASAGLALDRQDEWRRGFDNFTGPATAPSQLGVMGRLRRDESNTASTLDPYAQVEWESAAWTVTAGLRQSRVRMTSADHYVATGNPDDSGSSEYSGTMPVLGLRYRLSDTMQAYASSGLGFETPTLNEVAYRASGASGLNGQLQASRSRNSEMGLRARHADWAWTATVFDIRTDNEIAVLSNSGGRSTFQNAGRSLRQGLELSTESRWGSVSMTSALTLLDAIYSDSFRTCATSPCATPTLSIPAGNQIPGTPDRQLVVQLAWEPKTLPGIFTAEIRHMGAITANDTNSEHADAYTVLNLGTQFQQTSGAWQAKAFVRVDNVANRVYAGSVIVNEGNGRYFEAGAGRSLYAGVTLVRRFP
ncbi:MAG: TonB-dependent receptor [Rhodoferax sp.]|nr:TonB-dependent receptor [Rhodoferax sp.]